MTKKHLVVTHNGKFHADDVFGVATLFMLLGEENCEVIRTRDKSLIERGDYVLDVGEICDPENNRFDHHQQGGAGERENGIPYASFGLIWKKYGIQLAGTPDTAERIDRSFVQPIDAGDNGMDITTPLIEGIVPCTITAVIDLHRPTWKEDDDWDRRFFEAVKWAEKVLERQIKIEKDFSEGANTVRSVYEKTKDKRLIVFNENQTFGRELITEILMSYREPLFAVLYRIDVGEWQVITIGKSKGSFDMRKPLPTAWGAKHDEELVAVSGVADAAFCHRRLFMCTARSKEGALKLAELALDA
jgi:uncharacterized UPF0160 family protein